MPTKFEIFKARYGAATIVALATLVVGLVLDFTHVIDIAARTVNVETRGATIFAQVITIAGVLLGVMLAMLGFVTGMSDDRPVMIVIKKELNVYEQLVNRLLGPIFFGLLIITLAFACLFIPDYPKEAADAAAKAAKDAADLAKETSVTIPHRGFFFALFPGAVIAMIVAFMLQLGLVTSLLGKILLFQRRGPSKGDSPAAVNQRIEARREEHDEKVTESKPSVKLSTAPVTG